MASDRITVVVAGEGRHLFDAIHDPRVHVAPLGAVDAPDLVVFPCARHRRFDNVAAMSLPDSLLARIAAGEAGLVFDSSLEGVAHKPDITAALHAVIRQLGAVPGQCVYITQDRQYDADYRAHCAAMRLEPVSVLVHDYWIWDALSPYEQNGEEVFGQRLAAFRARRSQGRRMFVCLNRTPRPTKIVFLLALLRDGLWDRGFISFGGFRRQADGPGKDRPTPEQLQRSLPGFADLIDELAPFIDRLDAYGRVLFGLERQGWKNIDLTRANMAVDFEECDESWFTVITETEMRPRPARITEKVLKPLVNFHPLVVLGNPHALRMIRDYGFMTFDELFDEGYDDEPDPRRRFDRVYAQFRQACARSEQEWSRLEHEVEEKLIANAKRGLITLPSTQRRQNDVLMVDRILEASRHRVPLDAADHA